MQTFGRLKLDVENCVRELVDFGVAQVDPGQLRRAIRPTGPANDALADLLDHFPRARAPRSAPRISRRRSSASAR